MIIGINAAAAVKQPRTGVEEYTYQLIKHLTMLPEAGEHRFLLYLPAGISKNNITPSFLKEGWGGFKKKELNPSQPPFKKGGEAFFDFPLPPNFEIKVLRWPLSFLWTQVRLAWEMLINSPEALFIPAHILPFGAPKNSVVALHGLEYEYFPRYYSLWRRLYLRWSTKRAAKRAKKIIAISENTKKDLIELYGAKVEKIEVVHHGVEVQNVNIKMKNDNVKLRARKAQWATGLYWGNHVALRNAKFKIKKPYLLYVGRVELKKNILGILEAYKILKEQYAIPHELVLAGAPGYGYDDLKLVIRNLLEIRNLDLEIKELGYITENLKRRLLSDADIFLFPSFYEGFGLPVLEAQTVGVPVVTSYGSCLPEIAGQGALFVNPTNPAQIAEAVKRVIDDNLLRDKLIQSGYANVKRFDWEKCARETLKVLTTK